MAAEAIVVTGAAGALGRAVAAKLIAKGWSVVGIDLRESAVEGLALDLSGVDLTDGDSSRRAFLEIGERFGTIAGLVNVAGGFAWETLGEGGLATWDRLYAINVRTAVNACSASLPLLGRGGSIVNVGAAAAAKAAAGMGAYAGSKSAVARLTESLAAELRSRPIRVNAVLPSIIDTPANRADMPDADHGAWVTTEELANAIAFLLSAEASGINGALVPVVGRV